MKKAKIMIVEDEAIAAMNLQMLCERWGYAACPPVSSAREAMAVADRERPDLVLMDIGIRGGTDGIEIARAIHSRLGPTSFIFMSGYADDDVRERASAVGSFSYLVKPLDFRKLKKLIDSLLAGKK